MFLNKLSKFRKDIGFTTIASILSFVISIGLTPIMTRWYEPSDYGTFAIINNIATFMATAILFSLPNALPMETTWHRQAQLLRALVHLSIFAFIISTVGVIILLSFSNNTWVFLLLPVLVLVISLHRIAQGWANADGDFSVVAVARVTHPLIAKPFAILASVLTFSSSAYIVLFEAFGYFFQVYLILRIRIKELTNLGGFLSKRRIKTTLGIIRRHYEYATYLNFVNLLSLGFIMILTIILSIQYSVTETGLFTLAMSMTSLPIQLISMATAWIIYHKLIRISNNEPELLFKKTFMILLGYISLGIIPYLVIYFFGSELFGLVFGIEWTQSGTVASLLALPLFLSFLSIPISSIFRVTKTIKLQFIIDFIFIIPMMIIFYFVTNSLSFYDSLNLLAIGMSLHSLTAIILILYITWKSSQNTLMVKGETR